LYILLNFVCMTLPELDELETYFNSIEIPETVVLNRGITWHNVREHVQEYMALIREKGIGLYTTQPRFNRLLELKDFLSDNNR
jgi:hypothetical protein